MTVARPDCVLGLDLGTGGCRAVAFDRNLAPLETATEAYELTTGPGGRAEQDVDEINAAALACLTRLIKSLNGRFRVRTISLSGTASALCVFRQQDRGWQPLGKAWIWADNRAASQAARLREELGPEPILRTGVPFHATYWPAKLLWAAEQGGPELAALFQSPTGLAAPGLMAAGIKEYFVQSLTGQWLADYTLAAATGLFNSAALSWDAPLAARLGLPLNRLAAAAPPQTRLALAGAPAAGLGLDPAWETDLTLGSLDGLMAHLGLGCAGPGLASVTIGTSGALRLASQERRVEPRGRTWTYPLSGELWFGGGAVNNGGNVLNWLADLILESARLLSPDSAGQLDREGAVGRLVDLAFGHHPQAEDPLFLPYLFGERSPLWREDLSAAFIGLKPDHGPAHLCRAVVEGLSLGLLAVFNTLTAQVEPPEQIRASGGFTASGPWLQLLADLFNAPVARVDQPEAVCAGAAMLGWQALEGRSLEEMAGLIRVEEEFSPRPEERPRLLELYRRLERARAGLDRAPEPIGG